ncbi:MAG: molybdopterin molybdotransferase MoeA [Sedimentisphaerales bacterium]|nr:molybdopterin molybdotransferase MoeA [Sedimentisphaerales bacterium]
MITFEQAFEIVMRSARPLETESVDIHGSLGRVLANNVVADMDMPPFNKAAVDGYACRREDLGNELAIIETIPAGRSPQRAIGKGQCAKIMTGSPVPEGADCVVMVEYTQNPAKETMRFAGSTTSDNICRKGEDIQAGRKVLSKGTLVSPAHIAVLASLGCAKPLVYTRPKVGIIATGDELVEPDRKPADSQIRNSNSSQLMAQAMRMHVLPHYYGIAGDTENALESILNQASRQMNVLIFSGGVSAGDYDLVIPTLKKNGFNIVFDSIAVKPGKPTVFGMKENVFCFGLPGNPVSTYLIFELLVKPFLYKMMGHDMVIHEISTRLGKSIHRRQTDRKSFIPVAFEDEGKVVPVEFHGSANIGALCHADGVLSVPVGISEIKEGSLVDVRLI